MIFYTWEPFFQRELNSCCVIHFGQISVTLHQVRFPITNDKLTEYSFVMSSRPPRFMSRGLWSRNTYNLIREVFISMYMFWPVARSRPYWYGPGLGIMNPGNSDHSSQQKHIHTCMAWISQRPRPLRNQNWSMRQRPGNNFYHSDHSDSPHYND